jgi:CHASE2 domain-containing sensor protein
VSTFQFIIGFLVIFVIALLLGWTEQNVKSPAASASVGIGAILLLLLMGGWGDFDLFHWTPLLSYIPHAVESSITVNQDWIVGESKECTSVIIPSVFANSINKKTGYAVLSFHCDDGPFRDMKVRIYGRTEQPEHKIAKWNCTRESEGFTCRQTGAE